MIDESLIQHLLELAPKLGPLVRQHLSWCPIPAWYVLQNTLAISQDSWVESRYYLDPLAKVLNHHHDEVVPEFRLRKPARQVNRPAVKHTHYG